MSAPRVRLVDVASRVGVSIKTVSNVVNGTGSVGPDVRAQVLAAIDELGYRPNLAARQLRQGASGLIGLCLPSLAEPYFAEFASAFVDAAGERGRTVLVTQSRGDLALERSMLEGEGLPVLDGLVLSPLALTPADTAARRSDVPLVLIGEHGEALARPGVAHLGPDNAAAVDAATRLLLEEGRTRIAALGLEAGAAATSRVRFEGYRRALAAAGLGVDPALLVEVDDYTRAAGARGVQRLLDDEVVVDGLVCFNDTLALGALSALAARGVAVPGAVRVVGYDNVEEGRFAVPPLSTVDPNVTASSGRILDLLLGPAADRSGHLDSGFELVVR